MAELQMFVSYLERLQAQDTPTNTTRPSIHYECTPGSQIDRKKIGSMPFIRQSVSGPYPCIYPVLSTNKPGVRLQSLLSQLSKLDPSLETRVLKCFTLFSKLPVELRVKIWGLAANVERVVSLSFTVDGNAWQDVSRLTVEKKDWAQHSVPAILHVSSESRKEGLRYYSACFDKQLGRDIYINFNSNVFKFVEFNTKSVLKQFWASQIMMPGANLVTPEVTLALQAGAWSLEESVLRKIQVVEVLATQHWKHHSMYAPNIHRLAEMFQHLPGMKTLRFATHDNAFDKPHVDQYYKSDEGYVWRTLILTEHEMELKEEILRRIAQDPLFPPCLRAAEVLCKVVARSGNDRPVARLPLILEEDFEPVGLVDGEYHDKTLSRPKMIFKIRLPAGVRSSSRI